MSRANARKQRGAISFEYAILAMLIAVIAVVSVRMFGRKVACLYGFINYAMENPDLSYAAARAGQPGMTMGGEVVVCQNL